MWSTRTINHQLSTLNFQPNNRTFLKYLLKFLLTFCVLYVGTIAWIGITAPGGYYWAFAATYLNYVAALRWLLLHGAKILLEAFGFAVYLKDAYTIRIQNGLGVHVGYDCIGYGVMFFWVAFIVANKGSFAKKIKWVGIGLLIIWLVNVLRIVLMVIAVNDHWPPLLNLDNHGWFNIAAYTVIFCMIYLFDRSQNKETTIGTAG